MSILMNGARPVKSVAQHGLGGLLASLRQPSFSSVVRYLSSVGKHETGCGSTEAFAALSGRFRQKHVGVGARTFCMLRLSVKLGAVGCVMGYCVTGGRCQLIHHAFQNCFSNFLL